MAPQAFPRKGARSYTGYPVNGSKVTHTIVIAHLTGGDAHGERGTGVNIEKTEVDFNLSYHAIDL